MGKLKTTDRWYGTISATIVRADGTVEELGVISKTPLWKRIKLRIFGG